MTAPEPDVLMGGQTITACRACGSARLEVIIDLGMQRLSDFREDDQVPPAYPLVLLLCRDCLLVQLSHTAPRELLYTDNYGFYSGVNEGIRRDLESVVHQALSYVPDANTWLDIACNDGTLLSFVPKRIHRVGIDPVAKFAPTANHHADEVVSDYFRPDAFSEQEFDVITSVSVFYDLDDPAQFVQDVKRCLAIEGVWIIQQNYLLAMLNHNSIDNICLPPSDPVITESGLRAIGDVKVGDKVLTHTGAYHEVEDVIKRPYEGDLIELRGYGFGHTLRVTPGHPVLTERGFVRADRVKLGEAVGRAVPEPTTEPDRNFTKALAGVAGYYLAEGTVGVHGSAVSFTFGTSEAEEGLAAHCQSLITEVGGKSSLHQARTATIVQTYGWLAPWLQQHFGKGAANKRIPAWRMDQDAADELFRCYMAGDGYKYRGDYLRASTISQQLALDVQMLANRLGYKASISKQARPETCIIEGRTVNQHPLWDVLVHQAPQKRAKVWVENGIQWGRVREIRQTPYVGEVVNLEVAVDHTYSTPAMTVHNCHEHITYWTLAALDGLMRANGMRIIDVQTSDINGGSIRTVVAHDGARMATQHNVARQLRTEHGARLSDLAVYRAFAARGTAQIERLSGLLARIHDRGQLCYIYAASTRGATIWQAAHLDSTLIPYAVERNQDKVGRMFSAVGCPIISEEQARAMQPEYFLVGPWWFRQQITEREDRYLSRGGSLIFPLPRVEIVSKPTRRGPLRTYRVG